RPEQNYQGLLCGKWYKSNDHGTVVPVGEYLLAELILYIVLSAHTYSRQFIAIHLTSSSVTSYNYLVVNDAWKNADAMQTTERWTDEGNAGQGIHSHSVVESRPGWRTSIYYTLFF
uniref:hypothetical protein n=1 Tax=Enterococcus durans TaxID=53345 RepID=UPI001C8D4151